jgi:GrpB-like predicted nucleotidyltransferase (UPF0157 family)
VSAPGDDPGVIQPGAIEPGAIEVVEYDPAWPRWFDQVAERLRHDLAGVPVVAIEHVGSTSVPGLWAKPVLDIDIVVAAADVAAAALALERAGYEPRGEMGVPGRHAFRTDEAPRRNTYVVVEGCLSLRNHLGLRETLRRDPGLRDEYAAVKRSLAERLTADRIDEYVEGKSAVVRRILLAAGLTEAELDDVETVNRTTGATPGGTVGATVEGTGDPDG